MHQLPIRARRHRRPPVRAPRRPARLACLTLAGLAACSADRVPTAPAASAARPADARQLAPGKRPPQRSGVVAARRDVGGSAPRAAFAVNPPGRAIGVTPSVFVSPLTTPAPQNEPAIAVDPNDPSRVAAGANDYRLGAPRCGTYASTDGGATWGDLGAGVQPQPLGFEAGGDPAVAFAPNGDAYYVCLGFSGSGASGLFVARSADLRTFTPVTPAVVAPPGSPIFNDKEAVAVDAAPGSPYAGRVYVTWTRFDFSGPGGGYVESPIYVTYSADAGQTWSAPKPVAPPDFFSSQGSSVAVGPDGALYVAFENFNTPTVVNQVLVARSTDGGQTFGAPVKAADLYDVCPRISAFGDCAFANADFRLNSFPSLAVDPKRGHAYVVWADSRTGPGRVVLARSTDGAASWSRPVVVSDASPNDQIFPDVAASPDGAVHVAYYDRRDDPANFLLSTYLSTQAGGGLGFGKALRVNDGASNPDVQFGGTFLGDYIGVAASRGRAHVIWTSTRRSAGGAPKQEVAASTAVFAGK